MGIGPVSESAVRAQEAQSRQLVEQQGQRAEERALFEQRQRRLAEERNSTQNTNSRQGDSQSGLGSGPNVRSESTAQTTDGSISADNLTDAARATQTRENAATVARVGLDSSDAVSDAIGRLRESIQANEQAGTVPQPAARGSLVSILV